MLGIKRAFNAEKALLRAAAAQPAKAFLATALGLSAAWLDARIPTPDIIARHNTIQRDMNRAQLQHSYQIRHWSQLAAIPGAIAKAVSGSWHSEKHGSAPIVNLQPSQKISICDPKKPYPKDGNEWCIITADALEEHNNPNFRPGMAGQHRALTWPGEGDPIGPDPTRIQQWKNIDHVNAFHQALKGQLTPEQIRQAANGALGDVNPKLPVDKVDKVAPAIITPIGGGGQCNPGEDEVPITTLGIPGTARFVCKAKGQDMPFDSGTSHPPEEQYTTTPDAKLPLTKPGSPPPATQPR